MGLFSGVQRVIAGLKRMAADANVPTRTVVLTEDKRHAGVPALAELNLLLADPTYTPDCTVDPADPAIPPGTSGNMVALVICLRHPGAWDDDLIEVLARPQGRDMLVFHVEHLTDKWRTYWIKWRQRK